MGSGFFERLKCESEILLRLDSKLNQKLVGEPQVVLDFGVGRPVLLLLKPTGCFLEGVEHLGCDWLHVGFPGHQCGAPLPDAERDDPRQCGRHAGDAVDFDLSINHSHRIPQRLR